jgi:hypothetical protein
MSFLFGLPCFLAQNFGSSVYLPGNAKKWLIRVFSCFSISFRLFYVCALLILRQIVYCVCVRVCSFVVLLISGSFWFLSRAISSLLCMLIRCGIMGIYAEKIDVSGAVLECTEIHHFFLSGG